TPSFTLIAIAAPVVHRGRRNERSGKTRITQRPFVEYAARTYILFQLKMYCLSYSTRQIQTCAHQLNILSSSIAEIGDDCSERFCSVGGLLAPSPETCQ